MECRRLVSFLAAACVAAAVSAAWGAAILHPQQLGPLTQRWEWAAAEASSRGLRDGVWVGYGLRRLMGPNEFWGAFSGFGLQRQTLFEILSGEKPPARADEGKDRTKVWKPIAVLLRFSGGSLDPKALERVEVCGLDSLFHLHGLPLFWLGEAEEGESLALVRRLYGEVGRVQLREELVGLVALHKEAEPVLAFLQEALARDKSDAVRAEAASELGRYEDERALAGLLEAARSDRSSRVREEAVEAIGHIGLPEATKALEDLARKARDLDVREEAIEALLHQAPAEQAAAAFESIALDDTYPDLQEEALEGLSELPRGLGLPGIRKIAEKHGSVHLRAKAMEILAKAAPPQEAAELFEKIALEDTYTDLQEHAVEALSELPSGTSLPSARRLAAGHPNAEVRWEALELIAERGAPAEAVAELKRAAWQDPSRDVRQEAIEAISKLPSEAGFVVLVEIVRSQLPTDLREEAIEGILRQATPEKAAQLLEEVAFQDWSEDLREEAIEALAKLPPEAALPGLIRIAKTHPDPDCREEAVERLGKVPDPRARKVVKESGRDSED
jgi:HEAT repeat protein